MVRPLAMLAALGMLASCTGTGDAPGGSAASRAASTDTIRWGVGIPASAARIAAWDVDVNPRGIGLPPGEGTHAAGARVFAAKCAACHGARAEGTGTGSGAIPRLVGREPREGFPFGQDLAHVKTVGNYWPYATTIFDYVRRAMPPTAPGSLTADELYALTAFLLAENGIIDRAASMNARTLPAVRMPARGRFVGDKRTGGAGFH